MKRILAVINVVIASSVGIVVLLGYFVPLINPFRFIFLQWAVILAGVAVMIGVWNLFSVHMQKIRIRRAGWGNSVVLIIFMLITSIIGLIPLLIGSLFPEMEPTLKPVTDASERLLLDGIMIPSEISLVAVLAVTLLYASVRLLRVRPHWTSILFLVITVIILLGMGPLPYLGQIPYLSNWIRPFVSDALAIGGARGILIGVALGALTTGLRILFGADRPYGDS